MLIKAKVIKAKVINKDPIHVHTEFGRFFGSFFGSVWETVKMTIIFMIRVIFSVTIYYVYF